METYQSWSVRIWALVGVQGQRDAFRNRRNGDDRGDYDQNVDVFPAGECGIERHSVVQRMVN